MDAISMGVEVSHGDLILFLDYDAVAEKDVEKYLLYDLINFSV